MTTIPVVTSPLDLLIAVNTMTNNMFWPFMLIAAFAIMVGTLKINNSWEESFASSAFFAGVIGTLMGLICSNGVCILNGYETMVTIVIAFLGAVGLLWKRHNVSS